MTPHAPSGRIMGFVWLCAVALAVGGMAGLLRIAPEPRGPDAEWLQPSPFGVFIGTSLVRQAFPAEHPANDIFQAAEADDRIVRMAKSSLSDAETVERVQRAVDVGIKKVFVEIHPLLRTFRGDQIAAHFRIMREFSDRLRGATLQWLDLRPAVTIGGVLIDSPGDEIYDGNIRVLASSSYRVSVHAPRDPTAIAEALAIARRQGLDIVWVAMPRSQTAATYLGPALETAFSGQLQAFAAAFNATVWRPAIFWPNEFFIDHAHLNTAGRARFMSELRRYGATAP